MVNGGVLLAGDYVIAAYERAVNNLRGGKIGRFHVYAFLAIHEHVAEGSLRLHKIGVAYAGQRGRLRIVYFNLLLAGILGDGCKVFRGLRLHPYKVLCQNGLFDSRIEQLYGHYQIDLFGE